MLSTAVSFGCCANNRIDLEQAREYRRYNFGQGLSCLSLLWGNDMNLRKRSILGNLGWGFAADILLLAAALPIMAIFATSSFSNAYIIAFVLFFTVLTSVIVWRRSKKRTRS